MAKKNNEFMELLIILPWWLDLIIGIAGYSLLRWYVPAIEFQSPLFQGFANGAPQFAEFFLFLCVAGAAFSMFHRWRSSQLLKQVRDGGDANQLSWREFELLVAAHYRDQGYGVVENFTKGADGGFDVRVQKAHTNVLVQCKHWKTRKVGVAVVREMYGLLVAEGVDEVHIICSGDFTKEAKAFATEKPILLLKLTDLKVSAQPTSSKPQQESEVKPSRNQQENDGMAADCPRCGNPMVRRVAKRGTNAGNAFMGCSNFPKCRFTQAQT